jgi:hypothetical protein
MELLAVQFHHQTVGAAAKTLSVPNGIKLWHSQKSARSQPIVPNGKVTDVIDY